MTDDELRSAVARARFAASKVGTMHTLWETIFDAEAHLLGKPAVLDRPTTERLLGAFAAPEPNT